MLLKTTTSVSRVNSGSVKHVAIFLWLPYGQQLLLALSQVRFEICVHPRGVMRGDGRVCGAGTYFCFFTLGKLDLKSQTLWVYRPPGGSAR